MPLSFAVAQGQPAFAATLSRWLEAKRATGEIDAAYRYWILGEGSTQLEPRWSLVDEILGRAGQVEK